MVYWPGNKAAWAIDCRSSSFPGELKKGHSCQSEGEVAKCFTKTEQTKCKTLQNILLVRCYLLFKKYLQEKNICLYFETVLTKRTKLLKKSRGRGSSSQVYCVHTLSVCETTDTS